MESERENPNTGLSYGICVMKLQRMNAKAVDDAVLELFRASKSAHGEYDGWECQLIVDQNPINKRSWWKW
jgi:hypothetical protein